MTTTLPLVAIYYSRDIFAPAPYFAFAGPEDEATHLLTLSDSVSIWTDQVGQRHFSAPFGLGGQELDYIDNEIFPVGRLALDDSRLGTITEIGD